MAGCPACAKRKHPRPGIAGAGQAHMGHHGRDRFLLRPMRHRGGNSCSNFCPGVVVDHSFLRPPLFGRNLITGFCTVNTLRQQRCRTCAHMHAPFWKHGRDGFRHWQCQCISVRTCMCMKQLVCSAFAHCLMHPLQTETQAGRPHVSNEALVHDACMSARVQSPAIASHKQFCAELRSLTAVDQVHTDAQTDAHRCRMHARMRCSHGHYEAPCEASDAATPSIADSDAGHPSSIEADRICDTRSRSGQSTIPHPGQGRAHSG